MDLTPHVTADDMAERTRKAHARDAGIDDRGAFVWDLCAYCDAPYKHRGGKPICNRCYLGR